MLRINIEFTFAFNLLLYLNCIDQKLSRWLFLSVNFLLFYTIRFTLAVKKPYIYRLSISHREKKYLYIL